MRPCIFILLIILNSICLAAPDGAMDQESAKARAKWRMATLAASRQVLDSLESLPKLNDKDRVLLTDSLCNSITTNIASHVKRDDSMNKSRILMRDLQIKALETRMADIVSRVSDQSQLPVRVEDVKTALGNQWSNRSEKAIDKCLEDEYAKLFDTARARAVSLVRQDVEQHIRFPTETDLNERLTGILKDRPDDSRLNAGDSQMIQTWLAEQSTPGNGPVLEELQQFVADSSRKQFDEIRTQYEQLLGILDTTVANKVSPEKRKASVIADFLLESLNSNIAINKKAARNTGTPVYGFIPVIQRNINAAAKITEQTRIKDYLSAIPCAMDVKDMAEAIRKDTKTHVSAVDSEQVFIAKITETGRTEAAQNYAKGAKPSVGAEYFENLIRTDSSLATTYSSRIIAEVKRQLPEARRLVSDEQFKKYFGSLDKNLLLSDEAITILQDKGNGRISSVPDAVDILVRGGHDSISNPQATTLLQETTDRFLNTANTRFVEAGQALTAQLALLRRFESGQMNQLKKDVQTKRDLKDILSDWKAHLEKDWSAEIQKKPSPYKELLAITCRQLDKTVRQLYDSIKNTTTQTAQTERRDTERTSETDVKQTTAKEIRNDPSQPEERHDEDKNAAKKEVQPSLTANQQDPVVAAILSRKVVDRRNEPDGVLVLTENSGANCKATFVNITTNASKQIVFSATDPQASADAVFNAVKPQIDTMLLTVAARWKDEQSMLSFMKKKKPAELKLFVVIESGEVRHRMSLILRQKIEESIGEWSAGQPAGTPSIDLNWKVGLTYDPIGTAR